MWGVNMLRKNIKLVSLILVVGMMTLLLSGCMAQVGEVKLNADGSGTVTVSMGFTKECLELLDSMDDSGYYSDINEFESFVYNGVTYYGEIEKSTFSNLDELNEIISDEWESESGAGTGYFVMDYSDGAYTLTMYVTTHSDVESKFNLDDYSDYMSQEEMAEMQRLMDEMVMVLTFEFPDTIYQVSGSSNGISINKNKLTIDLLKLDEVANEITVSKTTTYTFSTNKNTIIEKKSLVFSDVAPSSWYYTPVMKMTEMGLFSGTSTPVNGVGTFSPDNTMTRAEFLTVITRYLFADELSKMGNSGNVWYENNYKVAVNHGIVKESEFDLNGLAQSCNRQEMAMFLVRALEVQGEKAETLVDSLRIPDYNAASSNYKSYVLEAYSMGLLAGVDANGTFNPYGTLTRGQAATVLYRMIDKDSRISVNLVASN